MDRPNRLAVTMAAMLLLPCWGLAGADSVWLAARRDLGELEAWRCMFESSGRGWASEPYSGGELRLPAGGRWSPATESADTMIEGLLDLGVDPTDARATPAAEPGAPEAASEDREAKGSHRPTVAVTGAARPVPLPELVLTVLDWNLALRSARVRLEKTRTQIMRERAVFDPTVGLSAQRQHGWQAWTDLLGLGFERHGVESEQVAAGVSGQLATSTRYSLSAEGARALDRAGVGVGTSPGEGTRTLKVTQPLLRGRGRMIACGKLRMAQLGLETSSHQLERLIESTIGEVEAAYWELHGTEATVRIAGRSRAMASKLLYRNQELFKRGLATRVDVITAEQGLAQRDAVCITAAQRQQDVAETLVFTAFGESAALRLASSGASLGTTGATSRTVELPALRVDLERALATRQDVEAARRDLARSVTSSKLAANELLPDLSLAGTVVDKGSWSRTDAGATTVEQREGVRQTWQVEAALTLPIENLAARAENERARQEVQEKRLALSQVETTVSQEIRSARRAVEMGLARLRQTQVAARHAANHLEAEGRLLDLGLTDTFRLLQVEEEASQARLAETQALVDYLSAITRYELSLGIIAEKYTRGRTAAVSRR